MFFVPFHFRARMLRHISRTARDRRGITILIVILVLTAILSISAGVLNVVVGQLAISGQARDSFRALYAADEGIEKWLFLDRGAMGPVGTLSDDRTTTSGMSYRFNLEAAPSSCADPTNTMLTVSGQDAPIGGTPHVKRGFQLCY
ncbi:MAG: pilus assembly PilX N-terminal domain-containing protein [bacterium]|nr:pilus assembly PilX N-terminal domain-containing protein [bacterium]MDZ4299729.1 pilus assembly PilX N-terminal domain-containing protein [Candidatus Sungbacteria bacterium]